MATTLTPSQLRGAGSSLRRQEEDAARLRSEISEQEARIAKRRALGMNVAGHEARLQSLRASLQESEGRVYASYEDLGPEQYETARKAAPKRYRTDLRNRQNYTDPVTGQYTPPNPIGQQGTGYTGVKGGPGDPRRFNSGGLTYMLSTREVTQREQADRAQFQQARRTPGTYRLSTGETVVSSLGDGSYVAQGGQYAGKTVTVRRPVATGIDGRPRYAPPQRPVSGFNLFDPGTRSALTANAPAFQNTGSMYAAAVQENINKPTNYTAAYDKLGNPNFRVPGRSNAPNSTYLVDANSSGIRQEELSSLEESRRYRALEKTSEFVAKYQVGFEKRQKAYGSTLSYLSGGFGKPIEQRSFLGQSAQVTAGIATFPVYGVFNYADASVLGAQKSFLYTGALITPETSKAAKEELKATTAILPEVYSDPKTYAYALAGGIAKGYGQYNVARRSPAGVKFAADSAVVGDVGVSRGAVSGSARLIGNAEVTYRYGPARVFSRTEVVPAEGSAVFTGQRLPGRGQPYAINLDGTASAVVGGKRYWSDVSYVGQYGANTGRVSLTNPAAPRAQQLAYFSQAGQGVPVNPVTGTRTAPSQFAVFQRNKQGVFVAQQAGKGRGFAEGGQFTSYQFQRGQQGFLSDVPAYAELPGGLRGGKSRYVVDAEQFVKSQPSGGGPSRLVQRGFGDLRRLGYYQDRAYAPRPPVVDTARMLFRTRKGTYKVMGEPETIFQPSRQPTISRTVTRQPRTPSFAGLPLGRIAGRRFNIPFVFSPYQGTGALSAQAPASRLSRQQLPDRLPIFDQAPISLSRPAQRFKPAYDVTPGFDLIRSVVPRQTPGTRQTPRSFIPTMPVPRSQTPPAPFLLPALGFPLGGSGGGGPAAGRGFSYMSDLTSNLLNIRGKAPKILGGLELRPLVGKKRRKKR